MRCCRCVVLALMVVAATAGVLPGETAAAPPFNAIWQASSGARPDSTCPPWIMTVGDSIPKFTAGALRIRTTDFSRNTYFLQRDSSLVVPDTLVVEARLRFESGSESVGPCGHYRQAAVIAITTTGSDGTAFFVGPNEIFMPRGECAGIDAASVPTSDAAHTYRIEIVGTSVRVFRDGAFALSSSTYSSVSDHGTQKRILWGEGSSLAYGVSYWEYVKLNAHATGCATTDVAAGGRREPGAPAFAIHAWPNPLRGSTRVSWTLAGPSHVRAEVYDLSGRLLRSLRDADLGAGEHGATWDGLDAAGVRLPPGAYLCRVESRFGVASTKLLLTR